MGTPKALLEWEGESFVERIAATLESVVSEVTLLGSVAGLPDAVASLPVVVDRVGANGPLAGLLAAFSARAEVAWLVLTCDQPLLSMAALEWLIGERRADRIAVLPRLSARRVEPFPAIYEPACRAVLEELAGPGRSGSLQPVADLAQVHVVDVPPALGGEFRGVNTPAEWAELVRFRK